jgi:hypothetical protein
MAARPKGSRVCDTILIECECGRRLESETVIRAYFAEVARRRRARFPQAGAEAQRKYAATYPERVKARDAAYRASGRKAQLQRDRRARKRQEEEVSSE